MIIKYYKIFFINITDNTLIQLFRYIIVGGFAFFIDFGLLIFLTETLNIHYLTSAAISFIAGLGLNYFLSIKWIFQNRKCQNKLNELFFFSVIGVIGLIINEIVLWLFSGTILTFHYTISKVISTAIVFIWNFTARKYLLFNQDN